MDGLGFVADLLGGLFGGIFQSHSANRATRSQERMHKESLDWEREAADRKREATNKEMQRRMEESQHRAATLDDVADMFKNFEGVGREGLDFSGIDFGSLGSGLAGDTQALRDFAGQDFGLEELSKALMGAGSQGAPDTGSLNRVGSALEGLDTGRMREIAELLASQDDSADMRKSALRELDQSGGALNAMLAQAGVSGSGFAAGQQRGLTSDVLMGLARDIATHRSANLQAAGTLHGQERGIRSGALQGAAGAFGQAGQLQLGAQGNLIQALNAAVGARGEAGRLQLGALEGALRGTTSAEQLRGQGLQGLLDQQRMLQDADQHKNLLDLRSLENISQIFQDEAFGANAPFSEWTDPRSEGGRSGSRIRGVERPHRTQERNYQIAGRR